MKNYICINEVKTELNDELVKKVQRALGMSNTRLSDVPVGGTAVIGNHEMLVLDQFEDASLVICKNSITENRFGENNNYEGSDADLICTKFADELATLVGDENIVPHCVDLTADDGLRDYGSVERLASLLTKDLYKQHVGILDSCKQDDWWWLATATTTKTHGNSSWVECVSPSGVVRLSDYCYYVSLGVRPFCILKSNIFVS